MMQNTTLYRPRKPQNNSKEQRRRRNNEFKFPTKVPKAAAWGWNHYPTCIKTLIPAILCIIIAFTTPFWAYVSDYGGTSVATFGLWHYCRESEKHCTSIHDNLVEGREVPVWFVFIQGTYFVAVACSIFALTMLSSYMQGSKLKMTVTVHRAVFCFLAISIFQQFIALHTFINYLEEFDFVHEPGYTLEFHGSFFVAMIAFAFTVAAGLMVYIDDELVIGGWKSPYHDSGSPYTYATNLEPMQVYKVHIT